MKNQILLVLFLTVIFSACQKDKHVSKELLNDPLTSQANNWLEDSSGFYAAKFSGGHYMISVDTAGIFVYTLAPYGLLNSAYSVQVDASMSLDDPSKVANVGFVFNYIDANNYSVVDIYSAGAYDIWSISSGQPKQVVAATPIKEVSFSPSAYNTIKIIQNSSQVELKINDVSVTKGDLKLPSSNFKVGIFAGTQTDPYYSPVKGYFNNFILTQL